MAAKRSKKRSKKHPGKAKSSGAKKSGKRPLEFLVSMRKKMMVNLPKLDRLIGQRGGKAILKGAL